MPPLPRSVHRIARGSFAKRLFSATVATAVFVQTIAPVARAVWLPTAGTNAFNLTSNWDGGTIDGVFNQTSTDNQIVTMTANTSVASLQFLYGGAFNMTLQSSSSTTRVLTLTSGITVDTSSDGRTVQIGATGAGIRIALGDQIQNFTVAGSDELVIFNSISSAGDGGINKLGTGTLRLEGTSATYTRGTIITEGTVAVGANAALGVGPITFQGGRLAASGGTRTLANNLIFAGDGQFGGNGPASLSNALTFTGSVDLGSASRNLLINNTVTFNGVISGAGGLNFTTGTTARSITLTAANTFGGGVTVGGLADLILSGAGSLPDTSAVSLLSSSADFSISGITAASETIGSLSGVALAGVQLGSKTLIVGADNTNASYAGTLEGSGGFTKIGTGTQSLTAASTAFTGVTRIEAGTLRITNTSALGANPSTATPALLQIAGGTLQAGASITVNQNRGITLGPTAGTGTAGINVEATRTLTVDSSITNSGTGEGRLIKTGDGTLRLQTSVNTFTGGISILGGTLSFAVDSRLGAVPSSATPANILIDGGTLLANTNNTVTLNANRGIAVGPASATISVESPTTFVIPSAIADSDIPGGRLIKTGDGTLRLETATSTFTGGTSVLGGTLSVDSALRLGVTPSSSAPANILVDGGTLLTTASITLAATRGVTIGPSSGTGTAAFNVSTGTLTITGPIANNGSGSGRLIKTGSGTLRVQDSTNTFTGGISLLGGSLSFGVDSRLGAVPSSATPGLLLVSGGTLLTTQTVTVNANRGIAIGSGGATMDVQTGTLTYGGVIEDASSTSGSLLKAGVGTLALTGANLFTGPLTVTAGTVSVGAESAFGTNPAAFSAAQLQLNGGTLLTTGTFAIDDSNRGLTLGAFGGTLAPNVSTTLTIATPITGPGSFVKAGAGRVLIASTSDHSGATQVTAGTLEVSGQLSGTTSLAVNSGGTLLFSGSETNRVPGVGVNLGGQIGFAAGETGRSEALGTLTLANDAVVNFGTGTTNSLLFSDLSSGGFLLSVWNWTGSLYGLGVADDLIANATQDRLYINTPLGQAALDQIRFYSDGGTTLLGTGAQISFNGGLQIVPVPEPTPTMMTGVLLVLSALRHTGRTRTRAQARSTRITT